MEELDWRLEFGAEFAKELELVHKGIIIGIYEDGSYAYSVEGVIL